MGERSENFIKKEVQVPIRSVLLHANGFNTLSKNLWIQFYDWLH